MRLASALLALTVASLSLATPASAQTRIACPLPDAHRTITSPLPEGWWTTPIVDRLSELSVDEIGGQPTLVCKYGSAGQIQMRAPAGQPCRVADGAFLCGARSYSGRVHSTGSFLAQQTFLFDLDVGALALRERGADVWFQAVTNSEMYLTPVNGTELAFGDGTDRGFAGCQAAQFSAERVPIRATVGRFVCVRTSDGRLSQFQIADLSGTTPRSLTIYYTTWN